MRQFSRQYGTAARRGGMGQVWSPIDNEDWEIGQSMIADAAPPQTVVYSGGSPLAQSSDGTWVDSGLIDRGLDLAQKVLTLNQIKKLQDVNLDRVRRGLAPLPDSVYRQVQPGVTVGVSPAMDKFIWIGLGLVGIFIITSMAKSR